MSRSVTICGQLNAGAFHKAKAVAATIGAELDVSIVPLQATDYEEWKLALKRELGGKAWLNKAPLAVYTDDEFIGDDVAFIAWLRKNHIAFDSSVLNSNGTAAGWDELAEQAYLAHLQTTGFKYAFMEYTLDDQPFGRMVFELYSNLCPKTVANFQDLCTDENKYKGSRVHRIMPEGWMQGGDTSARGAGGESAAADGTTLADECFAVPHDTAGIIGMANSGPHSGGSQFYVTAREMPAFDRKYVAFGRLVEGLRVLGDLMKLPTKNGAPVGDLRVCNCGTMAAAEVSHVTEDDAATRMQAMQRSRNARKAIKEKQDAANKMQAINRGRTRRKEMKDQKKGATAVQARIRGRNTRKNKKADTAEAPTEE